MRPFPTLYLAFALAGIVISPAAAETQEEENTRHEAARSAGEEGLKLYSASRWQEAFEAFQRAESAFHAPTLVLYMAHAQRMRGKLVDARALYQQVTSEALGPGAPNQFLTAQLLARGELGRLRRRIPTLVLTIKGAPADRVRATLDGAPLPVSSGASRDVDPGEHALTATMEHARPIRRTITLTEGATLQMELAFEMQPEQSSPPAGARSSQPSAPAGVASSEAPSTTPAPLAASRFHGVPVSALIAFGVGAAGLGVGAVTGAVALDQASTLKARCLPTKHCLAADQASADAAGRVADASTIGFLAGGAAIVTGVVLLLVRPSSGAARPTGASPVRFEVGPGFVTLEGAF